MNPLKVVMSEIADLAAPPFAAVTDLIAAHAKRYPRQVALVCGDRSLDYADLDAGVDRIASALQRDGVRAGDAIALCATNSIEYVVAFLGGLRAGAAVAPLPQSTTPAAHAAMIADTDARHLFLDAGVAGALAPERDAIAARMIALDDVGAGLTLSEWMAAGDARPAAVCDRARSAVQHHLLVGHDGRTEGHRATARDALDAYPSQRPFWLRSRCRDADFNAAAFQYDARVVPARARPRRQASS